jgi:hypothetical protein
VRAGGGGREVGVEMALEADLEDMEKEEQQQREEEDDDDDDDDDEEGDDEEEDDEEEDDDEEDDDDEIVLLVDSKDEGDRPSDVLSEGLDEYWVRTSLSKSSSMASNTSKAGGMNGGSTAGTASSASSASLLAVEGGSMAAIIGALGSDAGRSVFSDAVEDADGLVPAPGSESSSRVVAWNGETSQKGSGAGSIESASGAGNSGHDAAVVSGHDAAVVSGTSDGVMPRERRRSTVGPVEAAAGLGLAVGMALGGAAGGALSVAMAVGYMGAAGVDAAEESERRQWVRSEERARTRKQAEEKERNRGQEQEQKEAGVHAASPVAPAGSSEWTVHEDDEGNCYFYNTKTGVSQWDAPSA